MEFANVLTGWSEKQRKKTWVNFLALYSIPQLWLLISAHQSDFYMWCYAISIALISVLIITNLSTALNICKNHTQIFRQPWTYVRTIQHYTCWNDSLQDTYYLLGRKINVCKWHLSTYWLAFVLLINHLIEDQSCQALGGVFYSANCSCNLEASNLFMQYEYIFSFSCKRVFFPEYLCERG